MRMARNLTRVSAAERADLIDVSTYEVFLDLADGSGAAREKSFLSRTTVRFSCARPGSSVIIDVAADRIVDATLNGTTVPTGDYHAEQGLTVPDLGSENVLTVVAEFPFSKGARGMVRSVDPADGEVYLYTAFEPAAAQRVFACFDQPDLKATFAIQARMPGAWRAISNMPESHRDRDPVGAVTVHFATTPRMSTYLAVVCAGPYAEVRSTEHGRDVGIFGRPSMLEHLDAEEVFAVTRRGMDFFERNFGQPYPLPKYDHVAAPGYPGAMENFGCVVFSERALIFRSTPTVEQHTTRAVVILHELAHVWFGNMVTMRWWDDLWLKEAVATWAAYWSMAEATDYPEPWATFALDVKRAGIEADQLSSTHPVCADIPDVEATETNFDRITYRKGAAVLKQLAAYVGIEAFTAALHSYFAGLAWRNATFDDLLRALVAASGRPVREVAEVWLNTTQVNTLRPLVSLADDGTYADVVVVQEAPPGHPTLRTHRIGIGRYDQDGERLVRRDRVDVEVSGERTEVPALRAVPAADVLLVDDEDLTYAKVRLDQRSLDVLRHRVHALPTALARAICWSSIVDMVNDAELSTRDFIAMVVDCLPAESSAQIVSLVLAEANRALGLYADPDWAQQGWAGLAAMCQEAARMGAPGSPQQLTWVRAFGSAARGREDLAVLRSWYAGTGLPQGVNLDAELRWHLLQGLVIGGAAGAEEIDEEAERDRTISGQRYAAVARALIPMEAAKRVAWTTIIRDQNVPLETRLHAAHAYGHPAHVAVTPTHVADFLSIVDTVWEEQGSEFGRLFASAGFPRAQVSDETLAAIAAWQAQGHHASPVLRGVLEGRDQIARAVKARARDSAARLH